MAAITLCGSEPVTTDNLRSLVKMCEVHLPSYARPLFVRVQKEASLTATFKQKKLELVKEGFNPSRVKDPVYYLDHKKHQYVPITSELYSQLLTKSKLWVTCWILHLFYYSLFSYCAAIYIRVILYQSFCILNSQCKRHWTVFLFE